MEYKYKKLTPFKMQCLTNFPFIDEDFDALSNYGLLCKIVEYMNEISTNDNQLIANIEELNNWFNNLDVQSEVDSKLDEMAVDGTLERIINNDIFNTLNNEISALNTKTANLEETTFNNPIFPAVLSKGNHAKAVFYDKDANRLNIFQKTTGGYLMYELNNSNGDTSNTSVGLVWDLLRLKKIQSCINAYVCKNDYSESVGDITMLYDDTAILNQFEQMLMANAGALTANSYMKHNKGLRVLGIPSNGSVTYNMKSNLSKKGNVLFYVSSGSSKSVSIYINNKLIKSNIDLSNYAVTGNNAYLIEIEVPCISSLKDYTIKIENNDSARIAYLSCVNYFELKDYNGEDVDSFKGILTDRFYINSNGASDYAIHDNDLNKWCGSFHGGETAISQKLIVPFPTNPVVSYWENNYRFTELNNLDTIFYLTPYLVLEQNTNINNKGKMISQFDFTNDGLMDMVFDFYDGDINTKQFYTALTCNSKTLNVVKNPGNLVITNQREYLKNNVGLVKFSATNSIIKMNIYYSKFNDNYINDELKNGWIENSEYYNKFYFGAVDNTNNPVNTNNIQFRKVIECIEN